MLTLRKLLIRASRFGLAACALFCLFAWPGTSVSAQGEPTPPRMAEGQNTETALARALLSRVVPGDPYVKIDDMLYRAVGLQEFLSRQAATRQAHPNSVFAIGSPFQPRPWTAGVVYFHYSDGVTSSEQSVFRAACDEWQRASGVLFVQLPDDLTTAYPNYIEVSGSNTNDSEVGMVGGRQLLHLFNWQIGKAMHEIGHGLGLLHEHQRPDRDDYVNIYPSNSSLSQSDFAVNFAKVGEATPYSSYDFDSIMHYPHDAFGRANWFTGIPATTISPKKPEDRSQFYAMGQRDHLSVDDKSGMWARYNSNIVAGRVTRGGFGLAAVTVSIGPRTARTDPAGYYIFFDVPHGWYSVQVQSSGFSFSPASQSVPVPESAFSVNFAAQPSASVVTVSESDTASREGAAGFFRHGTARYWRDAWGVGDGGHMLWTWNNAGFIDNMGDWRPGLAAPGRYEVSVFIPRLHGTTIRARYEVYHADGRTDVVVNQNNVYDAWVSLGTYRFVAGTSGLLRLTDMTGERGVTTQIGFDSARWTPRN